MRKEANLQDIWGNRRCVIFDLDGTLIESLNIWTQVDMALIAELSNPHVRVSAQRAYQLRVSALGQYGEGSQAYILYCRDLAQKFGFAGSPEEVHHRRYEIAHEFLATRVALRAGAARFIRSLKDHGMLLAIATTTKRRNIDTYAQENLAMRKELPLYETFDLTLSRDEVTHTKPDPEVYTKVLETLGVAPDEALVFEDATAGITAARAAGIDVVVMTEPHSEVDRRKNDQLAQWRFEDYRAVWASWSAYLEEKGK